MDKLWINIRHEWKIMEGVRHEWTNYGLTYAMNGHIMEGARHEWTNYGLIIRTP